MSSGLRLKEFGVLSTTSNAGTTVSAASEGQSEGARKNNGEGLLGWIIHEPELALCLLHNEMERSGELREEGSGRGKREVG
jgi:hypothetical protein